jgi:Protein of unknown function (DUF1360)
MSSETIDRPTPFAGYAPGEQRPLGAYGALMSLFAAAVIAFATWVRRSGRDLPERVAPGDLALLAAATHKTSRLIAKDRVTSSLRAPFTRFEEDGGQGEVEEQARGKGLQRAIGELLICPYCLSLWIASALAAGLIVVPRQTRWLASVMTSMFGSDLLQILYKRAEDAL